MTETAKHLFFYCNLTESSNWTETFVSICIKVHEKSGCNRWVSKCKRCSGPVCQLASIIEWSATLQRGQNIHTNFNPQRLTKYTLLCSTNKPLPTAHLARCCLGCYVTESGHMQVFVYLFGFICLFVHLSIQLLFLLLWFLIFWLINFILKLHHTLGFPAFTKILEVIGQKPEKLLICPLKYSFVVH